MFRKEQSILSPVNCWNLLLLQVKRESRDHATLSDLYLNNIIPRFAQISEDSGRLFKKVALTLTPRCFLRFLANFNLEVSVRIKPEDLSRKCTVCCCKHC